MNDKFRQDMIAAWFKVPGSSWRGAWASMLMLAVAAAPLRPEIVISQKTEGGTGGKDQPSVVPDPEGAAREASYDTLEFLNGDKLRGTFFSLDGGRGVRWRHPAIRQVLEIDPASVSH